MRVLLKFELPCTPDAAWRAIRSPSVFRAVSAPFTTFTAVDPAGFPELWPAGEHRVVAKAFGALPIGEQAIVISFPERDDDVRIVIDSGRGLSGFLTAVTTWHHTMAVSPAAGGRTLYRDELRFTAGPLTLPLWAMYWSFWQWRGLRIRQLSRGWRDSA